MKSGLFYYSLSTSLASCPWHIMPSSSSSSVLISRISRCWHEPSRQWRQHLISAFHIMHNIFIKNVLWRKQQHKSGAKVRLREKIIFVSTIGSVRLLLFDFSCSIFLSEQICRTNLAKIRWTNVSGAPAEFFFNRLMDGWQSWGRCQSRLCMQHGGNMLCSLTWGNEWDRCQWSHDGAKIIRQQPAWWEEDRETTETDRRRTNPSLSTLPRGRD
jgi:hypothetical protein